MPKNAAIVLLLLLFALSGCRLNTPPKVVTFTATPTIGYSPLNVAFSMSASDADGDPVTCTLSFGDGITLSNFSCGSFLIKSHSYTVSGIYTAILTVNDGRGGISNSRIHVKVLSEGACPSPDSLSNAQYSVADAQPMHNIGRFNGVAYVPGELLVLRPTDANLQSSQTLALETKLGLKRLENPKANRWVRYRVPKGKERALAEDIIQQGLGIYAQPNYRYIPLYTPNDTYYNTDQKFQYDLMYVTQGWDLLQSTSFHPVVAVIDTGVAYNHPDLDDNVIPGRDLSDNDDDPRPEAGEFHGTMVASIFGAETNNSQGMAGDSNNQTDIMPLKVFPNATSQTIADAITWAQQNGANVLNLSLCITNSNGHCANLTNNPDAIIDSALRDAYNQGIVSLAASGNYDDPWVGYPASSQYTIAVGATDNGNPPHRADPGDWGTGRGSNCGPKLDVVAPGTVVFGAGIPDSNNAEPYLQGSGTSFASPYASGIAALYIQQYYAVHQALPTPQQVTNCLRASAQDLQTPGVDYATGAGLIRADRVLDANNNNYGCY